MNGNGVLTIKEAVILTGKSERTIYRYIKKGKLTSQTVVSQESDSSQTHGRSPVRLSKKEVVKVFGLNSRDLSDSSQTVVRQDFDNSQTHGRDLSDTKEIMKEVISEYFQDKETALMKPLEEMATYRLGQVETENKFLKDRLETLQQELKALPGPVEEVTARLTELEKQNEDLQKRSEELEEAKETELALLQEKQVEEIKKLKKQSELEQEALAEAWNDALEKERKKSIWTRLFKG